MRVIMLIRPLCSLTTYPQGNGYLSAYYAYTLLTAYTTQQLAIIYLHLYHL